MKYLIVSLLLINVLACQSNKESASETQANVDSVFVYIDSIAALGEGAIWNDQTRELYWIDIEQGKVFVHNPEAKSVRSISVGQRVGTIVPTTRKEEALVALQDGIYSLNLKNEALQPLTEAPYNTETQRFNDGKCDPTGRFWVGSMTLNDTQYAAALYRFQGDSLQPALDSVTISNGICWSGDKKTMYYTDTPTKTVQAFDYDNETGDLTNSRVIITISEGYPDGMTIDSEGKLWVALWSGSSVVRYDPTSGELLKRIDVPAKNVTSCAFGGANLDTLFITTASIGMSQEEKSNYPQAGALFATIPGVKGVKSETFVWNESEK